jgi:hypothetical protein
MPSIADFAKKMRRMGDRYLDETQRALDLVAFLGLRSLKSTSRFNDRTGRLRTSFAAAGTAPYRRRLSADTPYAAFVEYGTSRMRKRPYMGDARRVVVRELPKALADVIKRLARG